MHVMHGGDGVLQKICIGVPEIIIHKGGYETMCVCGGGGPENMRDGAGKRKKKYDPIRI